MEQFEPKGLLVNAIYQISRLFRYFKTRYELALNLGPSSAYDGPLLVVFGSSLTSTTKRLLESDSL